MVSPGFDKFVMVEAGGNGSLRHIQIEEGKVVIQKPSFRMGIIAALMTYCSLILMIIMCKKYRWPNMSAHITAR